MPIFDNTMTVREKVETQSLSPLVEVSDKSIKVKELSKDFYYNFVNKVINDLRKKGYKFYGESDKYSVKDYLDDNPGYLNVTVPVANAFVDEFVKSKDFMISNGGVNWVDIDTELRKIKFGHIGLDGMAYYNQTAKGVSYGLNKDGVNGFGYLKDNKALRKAMDKCIDKLNKDLDSLKYLSSGSLNYHYMISNYDKSYCYIIKADDSNPYQFCIDFRVQEITPSTSRLIGMKEAREEYTPENLYANLSPLYGDYVTEGKDATTVNYELFCEGMNSVPNEFIDFAVKLTKRLQAELPLRRMGFKKLDPIDYIKQNPKLKYSVRIDEPLAGYWKTFVKTLAKATFSFGLSFFYDAWPTDRHLAVMNKANEYKKQILKIYRAAGLKNEPNAVDICYYKLSSDKKYAFVTWPAISPYSGDMYLCEVEMQCIPMDDDLELRIVTGMKPNDLKRENTYYSNRKEVLKLFNEYMDMDDRRTRQTIHALNEAGHNTVLTTLTSRLYDHIVAKTDDIDFGEIPETKGDITKLPQYGNILDCISVMHDLLKEYKQDTAPVDTLAVALTNLRTRKDLFQRAFRYDCELPMLMYNSVALGVVNGLGYLIAACIEFIKAPKDESFKIALDKVAYAKTKDHLIFDSLEKFNKSCENGDFDKAMETVIEKRVKKFSGAAIGAIAGAVVGVILILNIIPIMRELIYVFYYCRVKISDFFEVQADLVQMNAYNVEHNNTIDEEKRKEIVDDQMEIANNFREISNTVAIDAKRTDVEANKELQSANRKYKVDELNDEVNDMEETSDEESSSALF